MDLDLKTEENQTTKSSNIKVAKNNFLKHKKMYICGILLAIFSIIGTVYMTIEISDGSNTDQNQGKLNMISRKDWLAQLPNGVINDKKIPSHNVIIAHTATEFCSNQTFCSSIVRQIQTFHMKSRKWSDIGYNFIVGGDGLVYECRGWDKVGTHTKGYNANSIGVGLIGKFDTVLPSERQLLATKQLIELGVSLGKLDKDYKLYGHRQLVPVSSPGSALFDELKKWPHFENKTEIAL